MSDRLYRKNLQFFKKKLRKILIERLDKYVESGDDLGLLLPYLECNYGRGNNSLQGYIYRNTNPVDDYIRDIFSKNPYNKNIKEILTKHPGILDWGKQYIHRIYTEAGGCFYSLDTVTIDIKHICKHICPIINQMAKKEIATQEILEKKHKKDIEVFIKRTKDYIKMIGSAETVCSISQNFSRKYDELLSKHDYTKDGDTGLI